MNYDDETEHQAVLCYGFSFLSTEWRHTSSIMQHAALYYCIPSVRLSVCPSVRACKSRRKAHIISNMVCMFTQRRYMTIY